MGKHKKKQLKNKETSLTEDREVFELSGIFQQGFVVNNVTLGVFSSQGRAKAVVEEIIGHKLTWHGGGEDEGMMLRTCEVPGWEYIFVRPRFLDSATGLDFSLKLQMELALERDERNQLDDYLSSLLKGDASDD